MRNFLLGGVCSLALVGSLALVTVPGGGQSFTLTATPVAGTSQAGDGNMTINSNGIRTWGSETW